MYLKTFQGKSYPIDFSLDNLENMINPDNFFRINRKYIVNMNAITNMLAYSRSRVILELKPTVDDKFDTIVSIERSSDFKKNYGLFILIYLQIFGLGKTRQKKFQRIIIKG